MATPATDRRRPPLVAALVAAVAAFALGWGVLIVVQSGIDWLWVDNARPAWLVIAVPLLAAVAVWVVRRFVGDDGHNPLTGIHVSPYSPSQYLNVILAILASLLGGLVLGPEVALVSTGAVVGTVVARLVRSAAVKQLAGVGALAAILALFAGPLLSGGSVIPSTDGIDLWGAVLVAVPTAFLATVVVAVSRAAGWQVHRLARGGPKLAVLLGAAAIVGVGAVLVNASTGANVSYVATSSEGLIASLVTETSLSLVLAVLAVKAVAYAVSLGAGFRGGPFFPAMFVGAASGLALALMLPDSLPVLVAVVAGLVGATVATAKMSWWIAVVLGGAIGFVFAGWVLVPASVVAAVVARAIPRFEDRLAS